MSKTRQETDRGALRDKVAVTDPATAPMDTDAEAAGTPTPRAEEEAATAAQRDAAERLVPNLDPSRSKGGRSPVDPSISRKR